MMMYGCDGNYHNISEDTNPYYFNENIKKNMLINSREEELMASNSRLDKEMKEVMAQIIELKNDNSLSKREAEKMMNDTFSSFLSTRLKKAMPKGFKLDIK